MGYNAARNRTQSGKNCLRFFFFQWYFSYLYSCIRIIKVQYDVIIIIVWKNNRFVGKTCAVIIRQRLNSSWTVYYNNHNNTYIINRYNIMYSMQQRALCVYSLYFHVINLTMCANGPLSWVLILCSSAIEQQSQYSHQIGNEHRIEFGESTGRRGIVDDR